MTVLLSVTLSFQQLRNFRVSRRKRDIKCGFAFLVPERSIGPRMQERLNDIESSFVSSDHERIVSKVVSNVGAHASFE